MNKTTLLFLFVFILFSCGKSKHTKSDIDTSELEEIILSNENKLYFHEAICDIETIPLESSDEILIGDVSEAILTDETIIIYQKYFSPMAVHVFDKTGKHRSTINRLGRGPQEYNSISHVALLPDNETIAIHDNNGGKILFFSLDGQFISSTPAPFWFLSMEYIDKNNVLCIAYGQGKSDPGLVGLDDPENLVFFANSEYKINSGVLPNRYDKDKFKHIVPNLKKYDNDIWINPIYTDMIYKVENHGLKAMYRLNMDKIGGTAIFNPNITTEEYNQIRNEKSTFYGFFIISDDYVSLSVEKPGRTIGNYLYSKQTKKSYLIERDPTNCNDAIINLLWGAKTLANNRFLTHIPAHVIAMTREKLIEQRPELSNVKEDDNPVIVLYSFKEGL